MCVDPAGETCRRRLLDTPLPDATSNRAIVSLDGSKSLLRGSGSDSNLELPSSSSAAAGCRVSLGLAEAEEIQPAAAAIA